MNALRRDPMIGALLVIVGLAIAGLVSVAVSWSGLAASLVVAVQLPYAMSGAIGGLALLGFALGIGSIQASRRAAAKERAEFGRIVDAAASVLAAARSGSSS